MRDQGIRVAVAVAVLVLAALPLATANSYDAKVLVLEVDGLEELPASYEYKPVGDAKTYTVTGRLASEGGRVYVNVTSPANTRAGDGSRLAVEYPVDWTKKGYVNDSKLLSEVESARVSFALGRLPADPPTGAVLVKATVDKTTFTLRILPPAPILVVDAPAEDGIVYVDVTDDAPIQVRTLYYPEEDRLVGPGYLGGKPLGMPTSTDIKMNGKLALKPNAQIPCGLHPMSVASKVKTVATTEGTIFGGKTGPVDAVAVLRAPTVAFPGGFVTDVAPAEFTLKCFPPQSRVQLLWASSPTGEMAPLTTFTVADSGALDEFVAFPSLDGVTSATVQARVVEGPGVLDLAKYTTNVTVPVRDVASSDELNLKVETFLDRPVYDLGDAATVAGKASLAGKPAPDIDVTVVWPFEDTKSTREDRLQSKTVRTDANGAFSLQFTAGPTGAGASFAPTSTQGERVVLATARKVGLNTGFARAPFYSTGLTPFTLKDVKWRPEVVQPGAEATIVGTLAVPGALSASAGILEGARVEVRSDPLGDVAVGTSLADGAFSVPVKIPAGVAPGTYPTSVVAWGRAPDDLGGVFLAPGTATATLKVGSIDAKPAGKDQRATVKEARSLGADAVSASVVHDGDSQPARFGVAVANGDRVVVAPGSELVVDLPDQGAVATFGNATRADFVASRTFGGRISTVLLLATPGEVRFDGDDAAPSGDRSLLVLTRFHDVEVKGADAVVRATPDGGVDLSVWKGTATVTDRAGTSTTVAAGKRLVVAGDASAAEATPSSLTGASPFAPPPKDDTTTPTDGATPPPASRPSPAPWLAAVALAVAVALVRRRR